MDPEVEVRQERFDRYLRRALVITLLGALALLVYGTIATSRSQPPIPEKVVSPTGAVVYTGDDIREGKQIFQRTDLMDFGSLYGNGAYFGPDWGTDYLHRQTQLLLRTQTPADVERDQKANRYGESEGTLRLTARQATAHRAIRDHYRSLFLDGDEELGLPKGTVDTVTEADQLAAFFGWVAWTQTAQRPGHDYSYTNNWPYEPDAGNEATSSMWTWTWASLAALAVIGLGAIWFYRRYVHPPVGVRVPAAQPRELPLTRSQRGTAKWFLLVPPLVLVQAFLGVLMAHAFVERGSFFGVDYDEWLPYNVVHSGHLQVAIAWIAAAWLGAGLFLAPVIGRREPRRQSLLSNLLWGAVVVVVVGSLVGIWLGVKGYVDFGWPWIGTQGLEFIQLGRAFQIALLVGLLLWAGILARAFWPGLRERGGFGSLEHLLLYSGLGIAFVYFFGLLARPLTGATMTDYWRWWVVHLWVENAFEFFTVAVTAFAVLSMGLLSRRFVERVVYFELILIVGSGTVGTGHHFYWVGEPAVWLGLGAMFSALEVIPLAFLLGRAWMEYRAVRAVGASFPMRLPFMFFASAALWNVLGAGLLGFLINPPIVNYYEHGQFLTLAHGHAAMFGSFGLLAIGLMYMALRGMVGADWWSDRLGIWALRSFNVAIVLWLVISLLPVGFAQLADGIQEGYWHTRSLAFYDEVTVWNWLRLPGDVAFALGGALLLIDTVQKLRHRRRATVGDGEPLDAPEPLRAREPVAAS